MAVTDIGIDLGSMYFRVYVRDRGVVMNEPAIAAYDKDRDRLIAYGEEAAGLIGHASGNVVAVHPVRQGSISDYAVLSSMLRFFIMRSLGHRALRKPFIAIALQSSMTEVEKRALLEASLQAGARDVTLVPDTVAAAIGAGIDITKPCGNLIVDIGAMSTKIALISIGSPVNSVNIPVAGRHISDAIMRYLRRKHALYITEAEAEQIKCRIASAVKRPNTESMDVMGRDVIQGIPHVIAVTQEEVRQAIAGPVSDIVEAVHGILEKTPPELAADVVERGIVLTGGGAQLSGLEERIAQRTGINVMTAENPALAVAEGTGRYTAMMDLLGK